jgi:hypothetical protein
VAAPSGKTGRGQSRPRGGGRAVGERQEWETGDLGRGRGDQELLGLIVGPFAKSGL